MLKDAELGAVVLMPLYAVAAPVTAMWDIVRLGGSSFDGNGKQRMPSPRRSGRLAGSSRATDAPAHAEKRPRAVDECPLESFSVAAASPDVTQDTCIAKAALHKTDKLGCGEQG